MLSTYGDTARRTPAYPRALAVLGAALLLIGALTAPTTTHAASGWELILDRPTPNFGGMDFVSEDEGWLVAGAGLLHTTDGGATWQENAKLSGTDVDFADAEHGWLVGLSGAIYATTDGGDAWVAQDSGTNVHLGDIAAISPTEAWAVGQGVGFSDVIVLPSPTALLHTTDGGANWEAVETPPNSWFREIAFVGELGWALGTACPTEADAPSCWLAEGAALLHTRDAGVTWDLLETDLVGRPRGFVFLDELIGWANVTIYGSDGYRGAILHTADGGRTWEEQFDAGPYVGLSALTFDDSLTGWAAAQECFTYPCSLLLLSTADGGVTWHRQDVQASGTYATNLTATDGALYMVGRDLALRSLDGGVSWQPVAQPALTFSSLHFPTRTVGYAISAGQVLRSSDAGRTWNVVAPAPGDATKLLFVDQNVGLAVGGPCCETDDRVDIYRTTDGAETWQRVFRATAQSSSYAYDAEFVDDQHGWYALEDIILFTSDGGESWREAQAVDGNQYLRDADLAGPGEAWVVLSPRSFGGPNQLGHASDSGGTWELTPTEGVEQVEFADSDHGWYQTTIWNDDANQTKLYATDDGGATWELVSTRPRLAYVPEFTFVDSLNGWMNESRCDAASGCTYQILHSSDGGKTWSAQLSGDLLFGELQFVDARTGWFWLDPNRTFGIGGGPPNRTQLYHTTDGGGGPIGATPTIQLPKTGLPLTDGSSDALPLALVFAGGALLLGAGAAVAAGRRT